MVKKSKKIVYIIILLVCITIFFSKINFEEMSINIYQKFYKIEYSETVEKYSKEYDIDKYLIYSVIKAESNFDNEAVSHKEAKGLMQLMYSTAEEVAKKVEIELTKENVIEPDININLGTKYIEMLYKKYQNISLALAAYNAGSGNVDNWISEGIIKADGSDVENIPFPETNNYVRKILRDYKIYKKLYN